MIVACLGVFFVFNAKEGFKGKKESTAVGYLKTQIPDKFMGVTSVEKPLGATEEVNRASEKILNVSDYLHREYTLSSGKKFTLYISYWEPGKEPIQMASTHTPDRCWINNGWVCNNETRRLDDIIELDGCEKKLKPARYGEYTSPASELVSPQTRYAWYWFLVNGEVYKFSKTNRFLSPYLWIKSTFKYIEQKALEMYFVRVDADFPVDILRTDKEFQQLLTYLGNMILFESIIGRAGNEK